MDEILQQSIEFMTADGGEMSIYAAIFLFTVIAFLLLSSTVPQAIRRRREVSANLDAIRYGEGAGALLDGGEALQRTEAPVQQYIDRIEKGEPESIEARLIRAGYYGKSALAIFNVIRIVAGVAAFVLILMLARRFLPSLSMAMVLPFASAYAAAFLYVPGMLLDRMAKRNEERYRRGLPDFMDLMIVCADAGLSLEAAVDRVSRELAPLHPALSIHLRIMTLEIRAGQTLRQALDNLARRIQSDDARALAVLFRQSEELGTSLVDTLRVYSSEMRVKRTTRAEEKANALPVKMVVPLGLFVLPVLMTFIALPLIVRYMSVSLSG